MNDDFYVIQELSIGHLIRRQTEITKLLESTDPKTHPSYVDLMRESTSIMKQILDFQQSQNDMLKSSIGKENE